MLVGLKALPPVGALLAGVARSLGRAVGHVSTVLDPLVLH